MNWTVVALIAIPAFFYFLWTTDVYMEHCLRIQNERIVAEELSVLRDTAGLNPATRDFLGKTVIEITPDNPDRSALVSAVAYQLRRVMDVILYDIVNSRAFMTAMVASSIAGVAYIVHALRNPINK